MNGSSKMQTADDRLLIDWASRSNAPDKPDEAVAKVRQAMSSKQPTAHGYSTIGMIYGKRGRAEKRWRRSRRPRRWTRTSR